MELSMSVLFLTSFVSFMLVNGLPALLHLEMLQLW